MRNGLPIHSIILHVLLKQIKGENLDNLHTVSRMQGKNCSPPSDNACVDTKSLQSYPALCNPMEHSPPGSSIHGIIQARILEWVAIPFSKGSSHPGLKPRFPISQADSLPSEPPGKAMYICRCPYVCMCVCVCVYVSVYGGGGLVAKSCPTLVTPRTVACQVPLTIGFSRQECWSGLAFPFPGDLSDPGIEWGSPALQADSLPTELQGKPPI